MNLFNPEKKVELQLVGLDGNIFCLIGAWRQAARRQGWSNEDIQKVSEFIRSQSSYDMALAAIIAHTN